MNKKQYMVKNADGVDLRTIVVTQEEDPEFGLASGETIEEIPLSFRVQPDLDAPAIDGTQVS